MKNLKLVALAAALSVMSMGAFACPNEKFGWQSGDFDWLHDGQFSCSRCGDYNRDYSGWWSHDNDNDNDNDNDYHDGWRDYSSWDHMFIPDN